MAKIKTIKRRNLLVQSEKTICWGIHFHDKQNPCQFLYREGFKTRKEARVYWAWKTGRNPTYRVVKLEIVITRKYRIVP